MTDSGIHHPSLSSLPPGAAGPRQRPKFQPVVPRRGAVGGIPGEKGLRVRLQPEAGAENRGARSRSPLCSV